MSKQQDNFSPQLDQERHYFAYKRDFILCNYDKALLHICNALKYEPNNSSYYSQKSLIYYAMHDYKKAIINIQKAIHLDKSIAEYNCYEGIIFYKSGDYHQSLLSFKSFINMNPKNFNELLGGKICDLDINNIHFINKLLLPLYKHLLLITSDHNSTIIQNAKHLVADYLMLHTKLTFIRQDDYKESALKLYLSSGLVDSLQKVNSIDKDNELQYKEIACYKLAQHYDLLSYRNKSRLEKENKYIAYNYYLKVIDLNPDFADAYIQLLRLSREQKHSRECVKNRKIAASKFYELIKSEIEKSMPEVFCNYSNSEIKYEGINELILAFLIGDDETKELTICNAIDILGDIEYW